MLLEERILIAVPPARVWNSSRIPSAWRLSLLNSITSNGSATRFRGSVALSVPSIASGLSGGEPGTSSTSQKLSGCSAGARWTGQGTALRPVGRIASYLTRADGSELIERCETVSSLAAFITRSLLWGRGRMLRRGMRATLEAIKFEAEAIETEGQGQ